MNDFRPWVTWGVVMLVCLAVWGALLARQWKNSLDDGPGIRISPSSTSSSTGLPPGKR